MEILFQFFWLICGAWVGVGNAGFFRYRLRAAVAAGTLSKTEADHFVLGIVGWIGGPCLLLWILQRFFANSPSPFFTTWDHPYINIAYGLCGIVWAVSFTWIWFLGGDRKLSRFYTLACYQTFLWGHPVAFRVAIFLMVASGVLSLTLQDKVKWPAP